MALSILLVGVAATPTTATAGTGPVAAPARSTGPAPGEVMCSFSGRFTFSPAIGKGGGFTVPSDLKGTLGSCQTTDGSVGIASGILSGTFSGAPFACALGCAGSDASAALSVKWKGTHGGTRARFSDSTITDTGSRAITSAAGDVGFFVPGVGNSSTVTGSFASNGSYLDLVSADTPGQYASAEIAKGGLKRLAVTGTLTLRDITAYVTNAPDDSVRPIDTATNTPGSVIRLGTNPYGTEPDGIAVSPDGATAYAVNYGDGTVTPINTFTDAPGPVIDVGEGPYFVAFTPNGSTAYVTNSGDDTVTPIDTADEAPGPAIHVGSGPYGIAITPDGATAYVANQNDGTVTPIDTATNAPGPVIHVGSDPFALAITPNGATVYVANSGDGTVTPIDVATDVPGPVIHSGGGPLGVAITPNGVTAYVANQDGGTVTPIAISSGTPGVAISVGDSPCFVAITPDGSTAYVTNRNDYVTPIDTSTNTALGPIPIGTGPYDISIG